MFPRLVDIPIPSVFRFEVVLRSWSRAADWLTPCSGCPRPKLKSGRLTTKRARTGYDEEHLMTYRGLLDAEREGAEWDEAALWFSPSIPFASHSEHAARGRAIWHARNG